jgi:hypothetical protein
MPASASSTTKMPTGRVSLLIDTLHAMVCCKRDVHLVHLPSPPNNRDEDVGDESGWKQIKGDVFRSPPRLLLFSALVGTGTLLVALVATCRLVYSYRLPSSYRPPVGHPGLLLALPCCSWHLLRPEGNRRDCFHCLLRAYLLHRWLRRRWLLRPKRRQEVDQVYAATNAMEE